MEAEPAAGLELPLDRLFGELQSEHERVRAIGEQAQELVAALKSAQPEPAAPPAILTPIPTGSPRELARRQLQAGESVDRVAAATGLPAGEVHVLDSLVRARNAQADTLKDAAGQPK